MWFAAVLSPYVVHLEAALVCIRQATIPFRLIRINQSSAGLTFPKNIQPHCVSHALHVSIISDNTTDT